MTTPSLIEVSLNFVNRTLLVESNFNIKWISHLSMNSTGGNVLSPKLVNQGLSIIIPPNGDIESKA